MCISINDDGWKSLGNSLQPHEIALNMGVSEQALIDVLDGSKMPTPDFMSSALSTFPLPFCSLFKVCI